MKLYASDRKRRVAGFFMLTSCNSSRTTLRMLFSCLSVCAAARILCTGNSLRLAGGTCCSNAHSRRCCGSLRFGRKTYCGRFIPRFCGATRRSTRARTRQRPPYRPIENLSRPKSVSGSPAAMRTEHSVGKPHCLISLAIAAGVSR